MSKYKKIPVTIETVQYDGWNHEEIRKFTNNKCHLELIRPSMLLSDGRDIPAHYEFHIHTVEGDIIAKPDDYIIKCPNGGCLLCKPDVLKEMINVKYLNKDNHEREKI